ncbi:MAG: aldose 1-epimerase family protein [Lachnospiraceae bacterium]|nr:aldose 1-epimerase family protein [Lachnospiraceae bacterium]
MIYTIENDRLTCTIDSHGCELKSVKENKTDKEYMWNGDPAFWGRTSPVLFPFVGSVKDKKYRYDGSTYEMGQHGFARDMEFTLISNTDDEIWMELTDSAETITKYPFHFRLKIGYRLIDMALTVLWRVENRNDSDMFFAIGAHPGFMMPGEEHHEFRLYDKKGNKVRSIVNRIFAGAGCVSDRTEVIKTPDGVLPITGRLFDGDALVIENDQLGKVELAKEGSDIPEITVEFGSPLVGLWSPPKKNAPFVCIEPWYGRCDSESFAGEISDRDYEQTLGPGKEFEAEYTIKFG